MSVNIQLNCAVAWPELVLLSSCFTYQSLLMAVCLFVQSCSVTDLPCLRLPELFLLLFLLCCFLFLFIFLLCCTQFALAWLLPMSLFCQALCLFSLYCNLKALRHGNQERLGNEVNDKIYHSGWCLMIRLVRKSLALRVYREVLWSRSVYPEQQRGESPRGVQTHKIGRWHNEADEAGESAKTGRWWGGGRRAQKGSIIELEAGDNLIKKTAARW